MVSMPAAGSVGEHLATIVIKNCHGFLLNKRVKRHDDIKIVHVQGGISFNTPVISLAQHTTVFGKAPALKANAHIVFQPTPQTTIAPPAPLAAAPPPGTTAPHTLMYKKKKYIITTARSCPEISAYVAKQLFDLAVMRKEMCPITAEEFSAGNTAVMPCGHLFMQMAIEESFKKEPQKCPWCRQHGIPTYV
jgi:hypothetical protein